MTEDTRTFNDIIYAIRKCMMDTSDQEEIDKWKGINIMRIVCILRLALGNIVKLPCSADEFAASPPGLRTVLAATTIGKVTKPLVVTDNQGIPLLYYLPALLTQDDQRKIFDATSYISKKLHGSIIPNSEKPIWRVNENYFTPVKRPRVSPGCLNFSPGWLAQGHHGPEFPLTTSTTLTYGHKDQLLLWLDEIRNVQILSNILIKLLHPEQFEAGFTALKGLRNNMQTREWAKHWKSVFSCLYGHDVFWQVVDTRGTKMGWGRTSALCIFYEKRGAEAFYTNVSGMGRDANIEIM
ncbi:hypothetical protein F5877DRAFT_68561 [Lentinula edodes]|nr:hypothetical protein F5877DRAFT_68561 [Lentinula edodes]